MIILSFNHQQNDIRSRCRRDEIEISFAILPIIICHFSINDTKDKQFDFKLDEKRFGNIDIQLTEINHSISPMLQGNVNYIFITKTIVQSNFLFMF